MKKKAIIISIKGTILSNKEKFILKKKPWGLILFKRNIKSFNQIRNLTKNIRKITKDRNFPILIDEEGSTVTRLMNIFNHNFDAYLFGNLYKVNKKVAQILYENYLTSLSKNLKKIGVNINTIPVLDVLRKNTNKIIGKRSFSENKEIVKRLGETTIRKLHSQNVATVIKHIPGHGCSSIDSHLSTPRVNLNKIALNKIDFYPFKSSKAKLAMTAHIIYSKIDPRNVATFSSEVIKIIRKKIGFRGILMSDDISMKALKYDLVTNAKKSLAAGCNLVLYCAGNIRDNFKLIQAVPYIDKFTSKKTSEIYRILR